MSQYVFKGTPGCRRCQSQHSRYSIAKDDVRTIARRLTRCKDSAQEKLFAELASAKQRVTEANYDIEAGHECDDLASRNWTKTRRT